jgi:hypothetical protein
LDEETKLAHCQQLHGQAIAIYASQNPFAAVREQLAEYVLGFARLMAIGITSDGKAHHEAYDTPYISAELHTHIERIVKVDDELGRLRFNDASITTEDIRSYCTTRASLLLFFANSMNMLSIDIEKRAKDPSQWYRAFVQAAMVSAEDNLRRELELPSLLPGMVDGLVYGSFLDDVIGGEPDPFFAWTKRWPDRYLLGRGPRPN